MVRLPKHLRPRWRYLAIRLETPPDGDLDEGALQRSLWGRARSLLGDVGSAALTLTVVRFAFEDGRGTAVVRVRRGELQRARAVVATLRTVDGVHTRASVCGVSGTIRACEENYLGIAGEAATQDVVTFDDAEVPAVTRTRTVDVRQGETVLGATQLDIG